MSEVEAGASRKNRTIFLVILALFVLAWIGTTIFGFFIVDNVREAADRTDTDMRALAWASIIYACNNDGRFPSDDDELLSVDPLPESIAGPGCGKGSSSAFAIPVTGLTGKRNWWW